MTLRDKILDQLKGSSSQNPVMLDALRKSAEKTGDDPEQLYKTLDNLFAAHQVNRVSGMKDGKPYVAYWLTGVVQTSAPAERIAPPRAHIVPRSETEQPATPINTSPVPPRIVKRSTPNQKKEKTVSKKFSANSVIIAIVSEKPGIKQSDLLKTLMDRARKVNPDYSEKSGKAMISWCACAGKKITQIGKGQDSTYMPRSVASAQKKTAKAIAKKKPEKAAPRAAAAPSPITHKPSVPAPLRLGSEFEFAFGVRKDGSIAIQKSGNTFELSNKELQTIIAHSI